MTGLWIVTGAALVVAVAAWLNARRAAARLSQLSDLYWELKYQQLELRKQVEHASGTSTSAASPSASPAGAEAPRAKALPKESFVPLTSLRR